MSMRIFGFILVGVLVVVGGLAAVLQVAHDDSARGIRIERADAARALRVQALDAYNLCKNSQRIRTPLYNYLISERQLIHEAQKQGIPLAPPELEKIQEKSYRHLDTLIAAEKAAIKNGCGKAPPAP